MDIKLLVLDIDGTIVGRSNRVNTKVREAIRQVQSKGIQVALATGRMYKSARTYHEYLNLNTPILAYNGAWMQNPLQSQEIIQHLPVPPEVALSLINFYEQSHLITHVDVHFYHQDELYVREITSETALYAERSGIVPNEVGDLRNMSSLSTTKVLGFSQDVQLVQKTLKELQKLYPREEVYITQSADTLIEANHPKATKGEATRYLAEKMLGISSSEVMAIGDNFNDLEMLKYAGLGIAMGNAHPTIQSIAQWVAPTVEKDGVAVAIQKFIL